MEAAMLIDTDETEESVCCETCQAELTDVEAEDFGDECGKCHKARVFVCPGCECEIVRTEAHEVRTWLCVDCAEARIEEEAQEALDAAKDEARELLEAILDGEDLNVIRKAVKALKRFQK